MTTKEKYENVTGEALPYKLTPKQPGQRPRGLKAPERVPKGERLLHKLFTEIGERMQDRTGGYLRVTKLGGESHLTGKGKTIIRPARRGDGASMVKIEIVD
ncbi:MAG: 50S ribosomal protein L17 [bacterium ADurb.Bin429]|nr:MAG: 50S ribosomal protein L17 [bacterium ADurb.Bin429]